MPDVLDAEFPLEPTYAEALFMVGFIMFVLGMVAPKLNPAIAVFLRVIGVAFLLVGAYWRYTRPSVIRMTQRQLCMPLGLTIEWTQIAKVDRYTHFSGNSGSPYCVRITLKPGFEARQRIAFALQRRLFKREIRLQMWSPAKIDSIVAECQRRMTAASV
jgi:hypothetical protein